MQLELWLPLKFCTTVCSEQVNHPTKTLNISWAFWLSRQHQMVSFIIGNIIRTVHLFLNLSCSQTRILSPLLDWKLFYDRVQSLFMLWNQEYMYSNFDCFWSCSIYNHGCENLVWIAQQSLFLFFSFKELIVHCNH